MYLRRQVELFCKNGSEWLSAFEFCSKLLSTAALGKFLERRLAEKEDDKKELEALRKEVAYWKFRYGNLLEMKLGRLRAMILDSDIPLFS